MGSAKPQLPNPRPTTKAMHGLKREAMDYMFSLEVGLLAPDGQAPALFSGPPARTSIKEETRCIPVLCEASATSLLDWHIGVQAAVYAQPLTIEL